MPDSQPSSDTSWFDALPRDQPPAELPAQQQPGQIAVNVGPSPRPPTPQTIERPSDGAADTSWFDKLPRDPPPEMKWGEPSPASSVSPKGADLPTWAGGGIQPSAPTPKAAPDTLGNIAAAIPSGLYEGVARIPNVPTYLLNAGFGAMQGITGQDYPHLQPPINTNPTGYQPQGKWAQGVHDAASAAANTAALGGMAESS